MWERRERVAEREVGGKEAERQCERGTRARLHFIHKNVKESARESGRKIVYCA